MSYFFYFFFPYCQSKVKLARRKILFRRAFPGILTLVVLKLKMGKSLMNSIEELSESEDQIIASFGVDVLNSLALVKKAGCTNATTSFRYTCINFFVNCYANTSFCIPLFEQFREQILSENNFRQKSGQVSQQAKIQTIVVTILYISSCFFIKNISDYKHLNLLILISSSWFFIGFKINQIISVKSEWKI